MASALGLATHFPPKLLNLSCNGFLSTLYLISSSFHLFTKQTYKSLRP